MTVKEYITGALTGFGIPESVFADLSVSGLALGDEYSAANATAVGRGLVSALEALMSAPRRTSVSENGFSESWDHSAVGRYYLWLCRRYGVTPSDEALASAGLGAVIDISDTW